MKTKQKHFCKFYKTSKTLDQLYPPHLRFSKIRRKFREFLLISEENGRKCFAPLGIAGYIFEKEKQLTQYPFTIHPHSKFCEYWESLVLLEIFLSLMLRPFFVSHLSWKAFMNIDYQALGLLADVIEIIDLGLRFIIGYIEKETRNVVLEFRKIFFHNLHQFSFYFKIITSFPLEFIIYLSALKNGLPHPLVLFSVFLKILKLFTFERYFRHLAKIYNWNELYWRCVWISLIMLLLNEWLTSLLYLAVFSEEFGSESNRQQSLYQGPFFRHMVVMYLVVNTFFYETGFYSTIIITGIKDMIISSIILTTSNFANIVFVGLFLQLFGLRKTSRIQYAELIQEVRKFLSQENLPRHVHLKVDKYFQFRFQEKYFREKIILETLSPPLRREISCFLCLNLILNPESIFQDIPQDLAEALCQQMTFEIYLPGDDIIRAGKRARKMYFIYSGSVAVYSPNGKEILHLYEGQQFGESAFLTNNSYVVTVIALEMSECYVLLHSDFIKYFAMYPDFVNTISNAASKRRRIIKGLYSGE